jgi:hypothetical protein
VNDEQVDQINKNFAAIHRDLHRAKAILAELAEDLERESARQFARRKLWGLAWKGGLMIATWAILFAVLS